MDERTADGMADGGVSGAADTWPLSARDAAALLGVSERTVRRAIARGELTATLHAGVYRIDPADLARYRARRRMPVPPPVRIVPDPPRLIPVPRRAGETVPPLPRPLTPLIAREREVTAVADLLRRAEVRLVTLTGPGGVGKTRLALAVAEELADDFADGVRFVPLAAVPSAAQVAAHVAAALGVQETGGRPLRDTLAAALRDADVLLVLDNFEHLLAATQLVTGLLEACPRLRVLVTSRTFLRAGGEHAFPVSPLALPTAAEGASLEHLAGAAAVRLFADRARAAEPAFALTETTVPLVAEVCRRLDGLPLAIELAAARVTHLSLTALRERLERRLPLLTGGGGRPDRHRTLRNAIAWSHDLLAADEQVLLRRLAVFEGGFTLEAAEAVTGSPFAVRGSTVDVPDVASAERRTSNGELSVLDGLAALVDASLVVHESDGGGGPRYRMLETIREFASERLTASGKEQATYRAHAGYFLTFAEERAPAPFLPGEGHRLAEVDAEDANLHAALAWLAANGEGADFARLVAALGWYWLVRGHLQDGRAWFERALARADPVPAAVRARIATAFSLNMLAHGEYRLARQWANEGLTLTRSAGDPLGAAQALVGLGVAAIAEREYVSATMHLEEALVLARSVDDARLAAILVGTALANLGIAARDQGRLAAAAVYHEEALVKQREVGHARGEALSLLDLGEVAREQGELARAFAYQREGLLLGWEHGETRVVVEALELSACTAVLADQAVAATRLFAATERLRDLTGIIRWTTFGRARYERAVAATRAILGESAFAAAWTAGRALPLERAVAEALDLVAAPATSPAGPLTPREIEVLRLLVAGKTDREIAEALFVSVRTIEHHVARIFGKLGVRTRTAAATAALAAGLVASAPAPTA